MHPFIHSFNKHFLSTYYVSGNMQSTGDATGHKTDKVSIPQSLQLMGEIDNEYTNE